MSISPISVLSVQASNSSTSIFCVIAWSDLFELDESIGALTLSEFCSRTEFVYYPSRATFDFSDFVQGLFNLPSSSRIYKYCLCEPYGGVRPNGLGVAIRIECSIGLS
jgi:hypothetical protein